MKFATREKPVDDAVERQLALLLSLFDEKVQGEKRSGRPATVRETLLLLRRRDATKGDMAAAMLLLDEEETYAPLRQRYIDSNKNRDRPLNQYSRGRVMQVPPGLDIATVSQWIHDGITDEQMTELERLHAINDERRKEQDPNARLRRRDAAEEEVRRIELPRRPTAEELAEDEAILQAAQRAAEAADAGAIRDAPTGPGAPSKTGAVDPVEDEKPNQTKVADQKGPPDLSAS